ncbi:hypothetical protein ABID95_007595 [Streptomyces atratus]
MGRLPDAVAGDRDAATDVAWQEAATAELIRRSPDHARTDLPLPFSVGFCSKPDPGER